jgi:FlaA1/EpsC-like NDP-sugar epimerase
MNSINTIDWKESEVLITGGTGTLGKELTKTLLRNYHPKGIRIFSRDEFKQWSFQNELRKEGFEGAPVAFLIGDVRNPERIHRAMQGVDIVIHTAAMKQVPACEYNPIEAIHTNIRGAENVINAAVDCDVKIVMNVSTDKAVYPINLYGMTKATAEKLFIQGNVYSGGRVKMSCCRYGNVLNSRGSVIPLFQSQWEHFKKITVTHRKMTRFFISIENVVQFILSNIEKTSGAEIFVPKMKSCKLLALAQLIAPDAEIEDIGIRQGEKLHECLITYEESRLMSECENMFVIHTPEKKQYNPDIAWAYHSDTNQWWWKEEELQYMINSYKEIK